MCKKPAPGVILMGNTLIVVIVFMVIDFLYYGLLKPGPDPYTADIAQKIMYTVLFSIAFAHLYNKTSRIWRPNSDEAFYYDRSVVVEEKDFCKATFPKILNGLIFSLLVSIVVVSAMVLSTFVIGFIFTNILHGIRGDISMVPGGIEGACVIGGKIAFSAMSLEVQGKTEDDPDR